jgi:hypothetical protein
VCVSLKEDQRQFLTILSQVPVRLTPEQTAWILNCQAHDIPILVAARLLKPLGNPPPNALKFFAKADVIELGKDLGWLAKATDAIHQHWHYKNQRRRNQFASLRQIGLKSDHSKRTLALPQKAGAAE